jgi:hypothetical protein
VALSLRGISAIWLEAAPVRARGRPFPWPVLWSRSTCCGTARRRAARGGGARLPGPGVGVGEVAARTWAIRGAATPPAGADGHGPGRRRPAVVGGRAGRSGPGHRRGDPHLLVVVDEAAGPGSWAAVAGHTVLRIGRPPGRSPTPGAWCGSSSGRTTLSWADRPAAVASSAAGRLPGRRGPGAGPPPRPLPARRSGPPPVRAAASGLPELLGLAAERRAGGHVRRSSALRDAPRRPGPAARTDRRRRGRSAGDARLKESARAAAVPTACAWVPRARARASCSGLSCWAWRPRTLGRS